MPLIKDNALIKPSPGSSRENGRRVFGGRDKDPRADLGADRIGLRLLVILALVDNTMPPWRNWKFKKKKKKRRGGVRMAVWDDVEISD